MMLTTSYSQFGEDLEVAKILKTIGSNNQWCFEVGAHDGLYLSNTRAFRELGWTAVLGEGHPEHGAKLVQDFGDSCHCVHEMIDDMDEVLWRLDAPLDIDFGVIDIDGADYWLWHDMEVYRPRIMLIEFSPYKHVEGHDEVNPQPRGSKIQTARQPTIDLAISKGYSLVWESFCNLLFVESDLRI